ncbi:hypothetical protein [Pannonibacter sp. SL95]|uniref:hypothetical protein n=1 Tax=Pannonibacter sp. SL95 TaxID=2995153 RepID=UPI00227382B9|nr:hypothetical protein [Pannonibacter sp. SL95]MCY1705818.1 hypothetical protein [Pannonibacter sp. SL95]
MALVLIVVRPVTAPAPGNLSVHGWRAEVVRLVVLKDDRQRADLGGLKRCLQAKCPDFRPEPTLTMEHASGWRVHPRPPFQITAHANAPRETDVPPPKRAGVQENFA